MSIPCRRLSFASSSLCVIESHRFGFPENVISSVSLPPELESRIAGTASALEDEGEASGQAAEGNRGDEGTDPCGTNENRRVCSGACS